MTAKKEALKANCCWGEREKEAALRLKPVVPFFLLPPHWKLVFQDKLSWIEVILLLYLLLFLFLKKEMPVYAILLLVLQCH